MNLYNIWVSRSEMSDKKYWTFSWYSISLDVPVVIVLGPHTWNLLRAPKSLSPPLKSLLLSHHHSTSALVSEILMSVLQTVQKNNRQFTYGQTVQKNNKQFTYGQTVQKKQQTIYIWTDSAKKLHWSIYSAPDSAKKQQQFTYGQTVQKTTAIYIWTVHIYRLYRRQCAKYTYIYSVRLVYYKDILSYQRHIIHRMGTSTLCTVSIHNVVYT